MNIEGIRKSRNMPWLKVGMTVFSHHSDRFGKVTGGNNSQNINVKFDGDNFTQNCHPHWKMSYFDKNTGAVIKQYMN